MTARTPQSSKLRARVNVAFRLIDDPDGDLILLEDVPCSSLDVERNRPGEADTASVTLTRDALPFDLRVIADKSMFCELWLYEEHQREQPRRGGPGHFYGVVDDVSRDRYTLDTQLACRDLTAIPLGAMMSEEAVKAFEIERSATVRQIVDTLLRQIPGTQRWRTESRTSASSSPALPVLKPVDYTSREAWRSPRVDLSRAKAHLGDIVPAERLSVWSAIANVCARAGIVPEVTVDRDGSPTVLLVDGSDLQTSDVLRPFRRGDRRWRVLVDGDGIASLRERLDLAGGDVRPDFVEVGSTLPDSGVALRARWPQASQSPDDKKDHGLFQFVAGVTSEAALRRIARAGYEALSHNQFRVELVVPEPWSAGGGPEDPDLLDLGYGAALEIQTPAFEAFASVRTPLQILSDRGLDEALAGRVLSAHRRMSALSLLFQVVDVRHSWSATSYRCSIGLRQFLGRESARVIGPVSRGPIG